MADTLDRTDDTQDQQADTTQQADTQQQTDTQTAAPSPIAFSWKSKLGPDLSKSPTIGKYNDDAEGLIGMAKGLEGLTKMLGHDKVPLPKGPDDIEGIAIFNKAIGVPDTAEGYNLPDATLPGEMSKLTFDKATFATIAKEHNLTPTQAAGLWKKYTEMSGSVYKTHAQALQDKINENINALRAEWGDAYAANIELGDMVISKFATDQAEGDFLTAALSKDPAGMKFLAKIAQQFSENKVGDFQYKRFSKTPDEAQAEIDAIRNDPNHPYSNTKAPEAEHQAAVDHVNRLITIARKKQA